MFNKAHLILYPTTIAPRLFVHQHQGNMRNLNICWCIHPYQVKRAFNTA